MASRQNASNSNNNNNGSNSRFAILSLVDNSDSDDNVQGNTQSENFEVTLELGTSLTRSFSDDFTDLERGISSYNSIAEFARPPAFFDHSGLVFDDEDCVFVDREDSPSSPRPCLGGGGANVEDEGEEENIAAAPLHLHLGISGFKDDDRSGTLGTISWVLAHLEHSGINPFPGRTYIKLPTTDQLLLEGYDKFNESFDPSIALKSRKSIDTMCKWIYDQHAPAMANLSVKINVQSMDNAVEFIFQKKTDKPHATVHGGSTQADVDEVVALVVAKHLAENAKAAAPKTGGGGAPKVSFKEAASKSSAPIDVVRASNTPKENKEDKVASNETALKTAPKTAPKTASKIGGSAKPTPPRCASWASAETILADLAAATPHEEGMVASATYTLEEGTPEEFATWCIHATGKKSTEISSKKDGKRRVRVFAGDKPGHVKKAPVGGGSASSKR